MMKNKRCKISRMRSTCKSFCQYYAETNDNTAFVREFFFEVRVTIMISSLFRYSIGSKSNHTCVEMWLREPVCNIIKFKWLPLYISGYWSGFSPLYARARVCAGYSSIISPQPLTVRALSEFTRTDRRGRNDEVVLCDLESVIWLYELFVPSPLDYLIQSELSMSSVQCSALDLTICALYKRRFCQTRWRWPHHDKPINVYCHGGIFNDINASTSCLSNKTKETSTHSLLYSQHVHENSMGCNNVGV